MTSPSHTPAWSRRLVRPLVQRLHAYVPGEQPRVAGLVKLNTNENPYPPSPRVLAALRRAAGPGLRRYPDPTAGSLRRVLARFHRCSPENLIVGNGSDELLEMATRAFVEPARPAARGASRSRQTVQYLVPSYSLYPVLACMHGARRNAVPLDPGFGLPSVARLRGGGWWDFAAALTFVTTPNAPSGRGYSTASLDALCRAQRGVVVLDEAYVDFAPEDALALALRHPHVLVTRTFSKAYSLCALRVGYAVGSPDLIAALHKVRDSYNVNGLAQVAACATLEDRAYSRRVLRRVVATRARVARDLTRLGFRVFPSQTNFLLVQPPGLPARVWLDRLRRRRILVRWFDQPGLRDCLRISIGTRAEMAQLLRAVRGLLPRNRCAPARLR